MTVETSRFGALEVDPSNIITLPRGLIGIPDATRFVLLEHSPGGPFHWLQSIDDPTLALVVTDPHNFFPAYEVVLSDEDAQTLGISDPGEAQVLTTVTVRRTPGEVTTNLLGPLVIGVPSRRAAQLVLNADQYTTRHPLPLRQASAGPGAVQAAA